MLLHEWSYDRREKPRMEKDELGRIRYDRPETDLDEYTYRVLIHLYYNIDYEDEYEDFVNSEGQVPLIDGRIISFDSLKRNGFDAISIDLIDEKHSVRELLNEELS